jgi:hypothetical protein
MPQPAPGRSRLLGVGGVPRVGLQALDVRALVASMGLLLAGGLLLVAAVLLVTVRRPPTL